MSRAGSSTFHDGFAALWHEPALLAGELMWRWCFGMCAWVTSGALAIFYLESLTISPGDEMLLSTLQPYLVYRVIRHVFRASLTRLVWAETITMLGLVLLWSAAASVGSSATFGRLLAMFQPEEPETPGWHLRPIFVLHLLRAMWIGIASACFFISITFAVILQSSNRATAAVLCAVLGMGLSWLIGSTLSWYFSVAPLFVIRNRVGSMEALTQAVDFSARRSGRLAAWNFAFSALRMVWTATMFFVVLAPLRWVGHISARWITVLIVLLVLLYYAGIDLLKLARVGAYASLMEEDLSPPPAIEVARPPEPLFPGDIRRDDGEAWATC